jgi:uncharacterized membrane protein
MAKTLSFACVHFTVAFSVGYLLSGSITIGGAIALVEPMCNTVAYFFHEKLWERRRQRREAASSGLKEQRYRARTTLTA